MALCVLRLQSTIYPSVRPLLRRRILDFPAGISGTLDDWSSSDDEAPGEAQTARSAWSLLMNATTPAIPHRRPVGPPKKHHTWNATAGEWMPDPFNPAPVEADSGVKKRPRGPQPKGKLWDLGYCRQGFWSLANIDEALSGTLERKCWSQDERKE